ncbi:uncharacterized protein LOC123536356 [Mercenaria mercenaria]|uniref:uncharacterized protein LOC123536356 n=1 Tax=Mercenaria mercenaria TaxID=6596 RepID=UPI00234E416E|nr:uncharacterized protein LOC123536356 [Mercenaria mercenaria]
MAVSRNVPDNINTVMYNEDTNGRCCPLIDNDDPRNPLMNDAKLPLINPREKTPKYNEELKAQINEIKNEMIRQSEEMNRQLNRTNGLDEAAVKKYFAETKHKRKPCWKLLLFSSCCHR